MEYKFICDAVFEALVSYVIYFIIVKSGCLFQNTLTNIKFAMCMSGEFLDYEWKRPTLHYNMNLKLVCGTIFEAFVSYADYVAKL